MEDTYQKILKNNKFYFLLPQHKNSLFSESITQIQPNCMKIVSCLKVNGPNLNSFLKFLKNITSLEDILIKIIIYFDSMENSIKYTLSPENHTMNFKASGRILFDNEKNILIHESEFDTTSKIFKFKKFKNMIRKKMESEIIQIFHIYDNYN